MDDINPWSSDAALATKRNSKFIEALDALGGDDIKKFCDPSNNTTVRDPWIHAESKVIVARRGYGKSHILAVRSFKHRSISANRSTTLFQPAGSGSSKLVERLTGQSGRVAKNHFLRSLESESEWLKVWQIAIIGTLVWRVTDVDAPINLPHFGKTFGDLHSLNTSNIERDEQSEDDAKQLFSPISWFLSQILEQVPKNYEECKDYLDTLLSSATQEWALYIKNELHFIKRNSIAMYLDNPDEAFNIEDDNIWNNAQSGLLLAIFNLAKKGYTSDFLKIYATIRSEAYELSEHADMQQTADIILQLSYSPDILENILIQRIRETFKQKRIIFSEKKSDVLEQFTGVKEIRHSDRKGPNQLPVIESVFHAILRHTRMIPRELVHIGESISKLELWSKKQDELDTGTLRGVVNSAAKDNIKWAIGGVRKKLKTALKNFAFKLNRETLSLAEISELQSSLPDDDFKTMLTFCLREGFLGYGEPAPNVHSNCFTQHFVINQQNLSSDAKQDRKNWYFLHPAFKEWVRSQGAIDSEHVQNKNYLVGHGRRFESQPPTLRLMLQDNIGLIVVNKNNTLNSINCETNPMKFLFICLFAFKHAGERPLTFEKINEQKNKLREIIGDKDVLKLSMPASKDQATDIFRNWRGAICRRNSPIIQALGFDVEIDKSNKNKPFMSIKNSNTISFASLSTAEIMVADLDLQ